MASVDISDDSTKYQEEMEEQYLEEGVEDLDINRENDPHREKKMKGAIQSFMKQMVSSSPNKMSLPICFSESRSLLEKFTDMGNYLDIFLNVPNIESPENRFLEILKFYVSGWFGTHGTRNPFNPVLGEIHHCKWEHRDSSVTEYIAEQISHHPPSSAFCFHNKTKGVLFHSFLSPQSKFWGNSFESSMEGKFIYEIPRFEEEYTVEAPKITVKGVVVGSLTTEVNGCTQLTCKKSGYTAEIEFRGRGLFKNKYCLLAKIKHSNSKKALYTLEGFWNGTINIINQKTAKTELFFDLANKVNHQPILPVDADQPDNFSRKVWKQVIHHLNIDNEDEAQNQKHAVEENQRVLAKSREGKPWTPNLFIKSDTTYLYSKLQDLKKDIKSTSS
ncbi:oxysterol binding family protein [Tieghemostelium lacteum]|uniref:Oxysterol binding family protein n=1 Tax=Tieghemostelium lacteum TaxID=361077 RepID=A0A151Z813_TIELA|nr:oxysterol binding family protein [Tieghemostelium lacteum]|eukprot:KYQ90075.1 oxysterol binding family protein [Tieghemostelium lacteum]